MRNSHILWGKPSSGGLSQSGMMQWMMKCHRDVQLDLEAPRGGRARLVAVGDTGFLFCS